MAHILREIGWDAQTLPGGYKAYRRRVVQDLENKPLDFEYRVVHGPTGSGKSRLLSALARAGAQVLDLEALAAHRGSVLGGLPDRPQPSQKMFDSLLLQALTALDAGRPVFVEGESKKIGQVQVPEALIARMRASPCVRLESDIETRVTLLLQEYEFFVTNRESLYEQLDCLVSLHGREKVDEWKALAAGGAWREFVARLLVEHYDPAYRRSSQRNFTQLADACAVRIAAADEAAFGQAAQSLLASSELQPA
jgi:tRNA 2-selenouridine synthase